jgi:hypothetical protein
MVITFVYEEISRKIHSWEVSLEDRNSDDHWSGSSQ